MVCPTWWARRKGEGGGGWESHYATSNPSFLHCCPYPLFVLYLYLKREKRDQFSLQRFHFFAFLLNTKCIKSFFALPQSSFSSLRGLVHIKPNFFFFLLRPNDEQTKNRRKMNIHSKSAFAAHTRKPSSGILTRSYDPHLVPKSDELAPVLLVVFIVFSYSPVLICELLGIGIIELRGILENNPLWSPCSRFPTTWSTLNPKLGSLIVCRSVTLFPRIWSSLN